MTRPLVITAAPTAFEEDGALDLAGSVRIVEHAFAGGVDAVLVGGTTAEFPALSREERGAVVRGALELGGPERVIAHVGASSVYDATLLTRDAVALGATSLAALTPFYLPASTDGIRRYMNAVRETAPDAELYLYLFPDRTGLQIEVETAVALVAEFGMVGVKVSIPGLDYVTRLVDRLPASVRVFTGNDGLLAEVPASGAHGVVSGVSSATPWPFVRLADALGGEGTDPAVLADAAADVADVVPVLGPSIASLKLALQRQGVIEHSTCRMAIDAPPSEQIDDIDALIDRVRRGAAVAR